MQRQKTIAKWLAVILLLTLAIGCYVALSTIVKNSNDNQNIAGADDKEVDTPIPPPAPILPTYTTLPRRAESVQGISVQHIGGESDDIYLDSVYFAEKEIVIFYTTSKEYDVKESGLYLAILDDNSLNEIVKISSENEEYISAHLTRLGLMIVTKFGNQTILRLYSQSIKLIGENCINNVSEIKLFTHANSLFAIIYDGQYLRQISIDDNLNTKHSTHVFESDIDKINYVIAYGDKTLIFASDKSNVYCLVFSQNTGFTMQNEMINTAFVQILPIFANGQQVFCLLTKHNENCKIISLSTELKEIASYAFESDCAPCIMPKDSGVMLIARDKIVTFCAHLDVLKIIDNDIDDIDDVCGFSYQNGMEDTFVALGENNLKLCKIESDSVSVIADINCDGKTYKIAKVSGKKYTHTLYFSGGIDNHFAYMCFGENDVFGIGINL